MYINTNDMPYYNSYKNIIDVCNLQQNSLFTLYHFFNLHVLKFTCYSSNYSMSLCIIFHCMNNPQFIQDIYVISNLNSFYYQKTHCFSDCAVPVSSEQHRMNAVYENSVISPPRQHLAFHYHQHLLLNFAIDNEEGIGGH